MSEAGLELENSVNFLVSALKEVIEDGKSPGPLILLRHIQGHIGAILPALRLYNGKAPRTGTGQIEAVLTAEFVYFFPQPALSDLAPKSTSVNVYEPVREW
jgi:hypothetical protein